jgi:hypothetical protein
MSMPMLASAVARRPHLFVDVRESSSVHSVAVRASVNCGKDKLESIH